MFRLPARPELIETFVHDLYKNAGIHTPADLCPRTVANLLGREIVCLPIDSVRIGNTVYVDCRLSESRQRELLAHELAHTFFHRTNQLVQSEQETHMQELDAKLFAFYACVPTFMLAQLDLPADRYQATYVIARTFRVSGAFAAKRLTLHLRHQAVSA